MKSNRILFVVFGIACLLLFSVLLHNFGGSLMNASDEVAEESVDVTERSSIETAQDTAESSENSGEIVVYVNGAIKKPGVYTVAAGTRVYQVLDRAGGFTEDADKSAVNLAAKVKDGQQISFPSCVETAQKSYKKGTRSSNNVSKRSGKSEVAGKVNLNSASQEEIESLPGVGAKTAEKIISYRKQNGSFARIEDILLVKGIGPKKYEKMKDRLTVGE